MKLPHYLQIFSGLAIIILTWVIQHNAAGDFTLPAVLITVLTLTKSALGLLTDSVPTSMRAAAALKMAQRGFVKLGLVAFVAFLGLLALAGVACQGCNGNVPAVVVPSVNLAVCVLDQYATAPACRPTGGNWVACVGGIAQACGADAAAVEQLLASHRKALVADGFVALPIADAGAQ